MAVKKAVRSKKPVWERIAMPIGGIIIVLGLIFALLYFNNRLNYRDLQKEYERISANIPADWQLVSESSNKGTWGLFCLQIEGEACPYLSLEYQTPAINYLEPSFILDSLENILTSAGYVQENNSYGLKCSSDTLEAGDYNCYVDGRKDSFSLTITLTDSSLDGSRGNWARVSLDEI